ncbi:glycoside hydrolase family 16 protein [Nocardioides panacisoli]|uniref:glycoside hydrolase family 16 protein n=1 Tax=Nocardioides panacisoli TaxID=627624 RepID=UPI0031DA2A47
MTLATPKVKTHGTVFTGRAPTGVKVRITRRTDHGWVRIAVTRADRRGHFRVRAKSPSSTWRVRAVAGRLTSPVRVVKPVVADPPPTTDPTDPTDPTTDPTSDPTTDPTTDPTSTPTTPAAPPSDACGVRPAKSDGSFWSCTFNDEFDGTTLDASKWSIGKSSYSGMTTGNKDCYVDDAQTVFLKDGDLVLNARRNLSAFKCATPTGGFSATSTGATVTSRGKFSQAYGRFEFRAKFPDMAGAPGAHSALWMYPPTLTYGPWPASGEIDVAEWFSARPANVYPSVHYTGENTALSTGYNCPVTGRSTSFHTYAVEWSPTVMKFYYDDKLCYSHSWTPTNLTGSQPFDKPFSLVMTQAWGYLWNAPTAATPSSAPLVVDWVRAWQ